MNQLLTTLRKLATLTAFLGLPLTALATQLDTPLRVLVGYPPGGSADRVARAIAGPLEKKLGVQVIVENKSGAGGRIAAQALRTVAATDNTLMLANPAVMVVAPEVFDDVGYDPVQDIKPVSLVAEFRFGLAASRHTNIDSVSDLPEWISANPSSFNIGVPGTGSLPHFFALMLANSLGAETEVIGYRGSAPLVTDLIGGQIPLAVDTLDSQVPQHHAGRLQILASSGSQREADLPDVPTFKEVGIDVEATGWFGYFSAASMPAEKRNYLGEAIARTLKDPDLRQILKNLGYEPLSMNAEESEEAIEAYRAQWLPVVKESGYRAER